MLYNIIQKERGTFLKNERQLGGIIAIILIAILVVVGLNIISNIQISLDKDVQLLVISGIIIIMVALIFALRVKSVNMDSHHKVQALALVGLTTIAIISLTVALSKNDSTTFIAVASAAAGGIAGFIAHKTIPDNKTVLPPLKNESVTVGNTLKLILGGMSTAGYGLTYTMSSSPDLPVSAKLNPISGEFMWKPEPGEDKEYDVTFKVTDTQGGTDSRTMKIKVEPKEG